MHLNVIKELSIIMIIVFVKCVYIYTEVSFSFSFRYVPLKIIISKLFINYHDYVYIYAAVTYPLGE